MSTNDREFQESGPFCPPRDAGPHVADSTDTELEHFDLFFDDSVITRLVTATNDYAEQKKSTKRHMYRRFKLSPLTNDEMQRYLGVFILLSISSIRNFRHAWNPKSSQVCLFCK